MNAVACAVLLVVAGCSGDADAPDRAVDDGPGARAGAETHAGARTTPAGTPLPLAVNVFADSARRELLHIEPPAVQVWLARVTTGAANAEPLLPEAPADTFADLPPPPLEIDRDLKPPILKHAAELVVPRRSPRGPRFVELDVRVDERGTVSEVRWVGGSDDPALVRAATECAGRMQFLPALRGQAPVAVWGRQRFDFSRQ